MSAVVPLYHFTCDHGARRIGRSNCLLIPQMPHPVCGWNILWFTTLPVPDKETTGLGAAATRCDRMAHRYIIGDPGNCRPWLDSSERASTPPDFLSDLESYGDPEHWWIASEPIKAIYDRTWKAL